MTIIEPRVQSALSPDADAILLELVVPASAPVVAGLLNDAEHVVAALHLRHVQFEAVAELGEDAIPALEARQVDAGHYRHFYEGYDFFGVGSQRHEALDHQLLVLVEEFTSLASENIYVFLGELEGHAFEIQVARAV